jgi:hypothetical protein
MTNYMMQQEIPMKNEVVGCYKEFLDLKIRSSIINMNINLVIKPFSRTDIVPIVMKGVFS